MEKEETSQVSKKLKTGEGAVSVWPKYSERIDENKEKQFFDDKGYVKLVDFLSEDEVSAIDRELARYRRDVIPTIPSNLYFYEEKGNENTIIRLEKMLEHDAFFKDLAESPAFNGLADVLLGMECEANNVQFFSKPPGAKATPPHQDGKYFMHERGLTFWLALDDADEENGCMFYVPKSQKQGLIEHEKTDMLGFSQELTEFTQEMKDTEVKADAKKGTLLGHHPYMVHRAGNNRSDVRWRPAIGLTYWAKSCKDDKELHKRREEYHKNLYKELEDAGKI
ncbi:probable alpha-ketoglutarate-dependent hypophosphite dioxygenase [Ptychodera flava]|uniref:probable alpha-ketoglutarate-dependent hypophosphite dioxygenase n=1 Tax=Ptychodera flava TaxID=63121 RepID=UPI003969E6B6